MRNRFRAIVVLFLLLVLSSTVSEPRAAASGTLSSLHGTVYVINATGHTVTVKDVAGAQTTLNVTRKTKILRNAKTVSLTGLVLGDQVAALFDSSNNARQLTATGPVVTTLQGGVGNVTSGTGVVQIANRRTTTNAQTNVQTRVVRNGKIASLRSLTLLDKVTAHLAPAGSLIQSPSQNSAGVEDALDIQAEGPEESEVSGTIATVGDPRCPALLPSQVQIILKDGLTCVTVNVTAETLIEVGGEPATINDLTVGMFVEAEYDPVTLNAFRIEAEEEGEDAEVEGVITAIGTNSITIDSVILIVDASTKIERNDAPAIFSDLQLGDEASAEYNIVTMIAKEIEAGTEPEPETDPAPGDD